MPPVDLDALFDGGLDIGKGLVTKAYVRFQVHPPSLRASQDVVDRIVSAYDERLNMIIDEIVGVINHVDHDDSDGSVLVLASSQGLPVAKAVPHAPYRPGSRGGKWYRDSRGNVRYGDPPEGKFMGNVGQGSPMAHLDHLRPGPFMGGYGADRKLTGFLSDHGDKHGFSDEEIRFLIAWYGTDDSDGGALFDAFLECAGLTRADLNGDIMGLRFGSQQLTYEEAVFEFFAAQGALFMGEEPTTDDQIEEWHAILNDKIKPLMDGVFIKYEGAKRDEDLQREFAADPEAQRRRFFERARRRASDLDGLSRTIVGDWNPSRLVDAVLMGMHVLGLIARRSQVERHAYVHGRPHLRDAVVPDGRLLVDGPGNPLLSKRSKLSTLTSSQLMLLYAAAELHRRWDPHSKSFSTEKQEDVGSGTLGEAAFTALASKSAEWDEASDLIRGRLAGLVDLLVARLNSVNSREGTPTKHDSPRKPRRR